MITLFFLYAFWFLLVFLSIFPFLQCFPYNPPFLLVFLCLFLVVSQKHHHIYLVLLLFSIRLSQSLLCCSNFYRWISRPALWDVPWRSPKFSSFAFVVYYLVLYSIFSGNFLRQEKQNKILFESFHVRKCIYATFE